MRLTQTQRSSSNISSTLHTTNLEDPSTCTLEEKLAGRVASRTYKLEVSYTVLDNGGTVTQDKILVIQVLMKATNGLGVILENRYYGASYPFNTSTTDQLAYLSTEQSL